MKKLMAIALAGVTALSMAGCASGAGDGATAAVSEAAAAATETADAAETAATNAAEAATDAAQAAATAATEAVSDVLPYPATTLDAEPVSYADYAAAETDSQVVIDTYVQAKQGWWEDSDNGGLGTATLYTQTEEGGYFIYNIHMPEEDYDKLTEGAELKVSGYKSEWEGEIEITDVDAYEIGDGNWVAEPTDVTAELGKDTLAEYQNQKVSFKDLVVAPAQEGSDAAFLYNYDGSGSEGDDLYFNVTTAEDPDTIYTFTVESYLCGSDTDVYKAVEGLKVGDTIDAEGFLYWYEGAQPHVTDVTVK
jgi:hypothetical protein